MYPNKIEGDYRCTSEHNFSNSSQSSAVRLVFGRGYDKSRKGKRVNSSTYRKGAKGIIEYPLNKVI